MHSLAEGTLVTGLEVALVHSPGPTEAHGQPEHQDRRHPAKKIKKTTLNLRWLRLLLHQSPVQFIDSHLVEHCTSIYSRGPRPNHSRYTGVKLIQSPDFDLSVVVKCVLK